MKNDTFFPILVDTNTKVVQGGISKREYLAGVAMQGLLSSGMRDDWKTMGETADRAVQYADALIEKLEK